MTNPHVLFLASALALVACGGTSRTADVRPDTAADVPADPGADSAVLEVTSDNGLEGSEPMPDAAPDVTADAAPDTVPDAAPDSAADAAPDAVPDDWHLQYGTPCPLDRRVGLFEVGVDSYGLAAFTGYVADRMNALQVLEPKESEGPCVLLERPNPSCIPPCEGSQQCTADGQCVPFPVNQGVGTVTVTGLKAPLSLAPDGQKAYTSTDFEGTPFTPGANLELTAAGGDVPGFSLQGEGVALLELPTKSWPYHAGDPTTVTWAPGNGVGTIRLNLNVDQHGLTPVTLVCDVPDTGSYTVPGTLTAALSAYGVSGAPSSSIVRRTVDSIDVPGGLARGSLGEGGCVEFVVSHRVKTLLTVL